MTTLAQILEQNSTYAVVSHIDPDLDAISSVLSLLFYMNQNGIQARGYLENIPDYTDFLYGWDLFDLGHQVSLPEKYTLITLDCASVSRIWPSSLFQKTKSVINLDHHIDNPGFGSMNFVSHEVSSTAELLFQMMKTESYSVPKEIASNLYAGLLFDTGGFRYSNTKISTFETAKQMIQIGVNPTYLAEKVFNRWEKNGFQALELSLSTIEYWDKNQILFSFIPYQMISKLNLLNSDFEGVIDFLRVRRSIKVSILIREMEPGYYKGSIRSIEPYAINDIVRPFHGGGHKRAAGFSTSDYTISEIKSILQETLKPILSKQE